MHRVTLVLVLLPIIGCGESPATLDAAATDSGAIDLDAARGLNDDAAGTSALIRAAEGGLVRSADGSFAIYVFPGALTQDTTISIKRVAESDLPADVRAEAPLGGVYAVEPDGLTFGGDGAWAHYHFAAPPAGTIRMVEGVPEYADLDTRARSAAGGAIESHPIISTTYDLPANTVDVITRLAHLSLQMVVATKEGEAGYLRAEMGATTQTVGTPWHVTDVKTTFPRTYHGDALQPLDTASIRIGMAWLSAVNFEQVTPSDRKLLAGVASAFGLSNRDGTFAGERDPGSPTNMGTDHLTWEPVGPHVVCDTNHLATLSLVTSVSYVGGGYHQVTVRQDYDCVRAAAAATVTQTKTCVRQDPAIVCDAPTVVTPRATALPETTTTFVLAASPYTMKLVPAADPPAPGPDTITAVNGTATVTFTRTPENKYVPTVDGEPAWAAGVPTLWTANGAFSATSDPAAAAAYHFGPADKFATNIVIDTAPAEGGVEVRLTRPGAITCAGKPYTDLEVAGVPEITPLPDGTRGYQAPILRAIEAATKHCAISMADFTAVPFTIDVAVNSTAAIKLPTANVSVRTGTALRIDSATLLAEICDGLDNDGDNVVDKGCPSGLVWPSSDTSFGPVLGPGGGNATNNGGCGYPGATIGICVNVDASGSLRSIRGRCASSRLIIDKSAIPYRYSFETTMVGSTGDGCGIGGGSSGGMPFEHTCGPGEVVDTISGEYGTDIGQLSFRCAKLEIRRVDGGVWGIVRTTTSKSPTFGTGTGTPFSWTVENHKTTGFPGMVRYWIMNTGKDGLPGNVRSIQPQGTSPYLRYLGF